MILMLKPNPVFIPHWSGEVVMRTPKHSTKAPTKKSNKNKRRKFK